MVLNQDDFAPQTTRDIWICLETFFGCHSLRGTSLYVETRDAAKHLTMHRTAPQQGIIRTKGEVKALHFKNGRNVFQTQEKI